ncbi:hypothetical protein CASFOL_028229 [Castilleja foliolosa]|uniref:Helitron helicase-like domain-containing protein n=1 Tax=Castilleja foliolosa TaxID=1961234 RepID=A0ABD3CEV3_9LAMI
MSSRSSRTRRLLNRANVYILMMGIASIYANIVLLFFWFAERIVYGPLHARPRYTHCCKNGPVRLPLPLDPPPAIRVLFEDSNFMENVRAYNNMFSMTSFGARVDDAVNDGHDPYVFKVSGQVSHWIGSICPPDNEHPRFLQLYIYDTENEVPNRMRFFSSSDHRSISPNVVRTLSDTLKSCNEFARLFTSAKDLCQTSEGCDFSVRLYNNLGDRRYEPPASGTLSGIVYADDPNACNYDVVVRKKGGQPQRIHDRHNVYSLLLKGGRLFQQYLVDAYTCIEQSRLDFVNVNQNIFRSEFVSALYEALAKGDNNAHDIALLWPEISRHLDKVGGAQAQNRPDIISGVFCIKVQQFLRFMLSANTFGEVTAGTHEEGVGRDDEATN